MASLKTLFPELHERDVHMEDFSCAVYQRILVHGRMYITLNHLCFKADIFGFKARVLLPFREIAHMQRSMTNIINPSITINTIHKQTHVFASFLFRDHTFRILEDLWKVQLECHGFLGLNPPDVSTSQLHKYSVQQQEQTDAFIGYTSSRVKSNVRKRSDSFEPPSPRVSAPPNRPRSATSDSLVQRPTCLDLNSTPIFAAKLPVSVSTAVQVLFSDKSSFPSEFMHGQGGSDIRIDKWSKVELEESAALAPHADVNQIDPPMDANALKLDASEGASSSSESRLPPPTDAARVESESAFDIPSENIRQVLWKCPVKSRLSPIRQTRVEEIHRLSLCCAEHVTIQIHQVMVDVPYGDYFSVQLSFVITTERPTFISQKSLKIHQIADAICDGSSGCYLTVSAEIKFSKPMLLRRKVESDALAECRGNYANAIPILNNIFLQGGCLNESPPYPSQVGKSSICSQNCVSPESEAMERQGFLSEIIAWAVTTLISLVVVAIIPRIRRASARCKVLLITFKTRMRISSITLLAVVGLIISLTQSCILLRRELQETRQLLDSSELSRHVLLKQIAVLAPFAPKGAENG